VSNVPVYGTDSVAQFTLALLLELASRVGEHDRAVHEGAWSRSPDFSFWRAPPVELAGLTFGVVGFGAIGRRVGGLADTVEDRVTGFLFDEYQPWALEEAVQYAIDLYGDREAWERHVRQAMSRDFSWTSSIARYRDVYRRAGESGDRRCQRNSQRTALAGFDIGNATIEHRCGGKDLCARRPRTEPAPRDFAQQRQRFGHIGIVQALQRQPGTDGR